LDGGALIVIFHVRRSHVRQPSRLADGVNERRQRVGGGQLDAGRLRLATHLGQLRHRGDLVWNFEFRGLAIDKLRGLHERRVHFDFSGGSVDDIAQELDCLLPAQRSLAGIGFLLVRRRARGRRDDSSSWPHYHRPPCLYSLLLGDMRQLRLTRLQHIGQTSHAGRF
jgi:hypothetical protein